jgi:hypothetical protein
MKVDGKEEYDVEVSNRFAALGHLILRWILIMLGKVLERV